MKFLFCQVTLDHKMTHFLTLWHFCCKMTLLSLHYNFVCFILEISNNSPNNKYINNSIVVNKTKINWSVVIITSAGQLPQAAPLYWWVSGWNYWSGLDWIWICGSSLIDCLRILFLSVCRYDTVFLGALIFLSDHSSSVQSHWFIDFSFLTSNLRRVSVGWLYI